MGMMLDWRGASQVVLRPLLSWLVVDAGFEDSALCSAVLGPFSLTFYSAKGSLGSNAVFRGWAGLDSEPSFAYLCCER